MQTLIIGPNEAGQRLDKFLVKYMKRAPVSFFYRMMRKKNIVLNGKRCEGQEKLKEGDEIRLFFSRETLEKFGATPFDEAALSEYEKAFRTLPPIRILYEDADILAAHKHSGVLSQKASLQDLTLNEWLTGYLIAKKELDPVSLSTFKPSVCNRLDRNTEGIVLCGKSLEGLQFLTELIRSRLLHKRYRFLALGELTDSCVLTGWIAKDSRKNRASVYDAPCPGALPIRTDLRPIGTFSLPGCGRVTDVEAELVTGKSHQIRAQLSHIGHPLLGDPKYGDPKANAACRQWGISCQALCARQVIFPEQIPEAYKKFSYLAGHALTAPLPKSYRAVLTAGGALQKEK